MGLFYEDSVLAFIWITCVFGAGAAWMSGRAMAATWRE